MSYTLAPLVDFLTHSTKLPHGASITIALLVGLSILLALILVISHSIKDLTRNAKQCEMHVYFCLCLRLCVCVLRDDADPQRECVPPLLHFAVMYTD